MLFTPQSIKKIVRKYSKYASQGTLDLTDFLEEEGRGISNEEIIEIALALKKEPSITSVEIGIAQLTVEAAQALINIPQKKLSFIGSGLGDEVVAVLATCSLEELWLDTCQITDEQASTLFSNNSIKKLMLADNKIRGKALEKLPQNTSLKWLDLSDNRIEESYYQYVGMNQSLKILYVSDNGMGDEGLRGLCTSSSLEEIHAAYGKVTTICPLSPSLKKLILSRNKVVNIEELLRCEPLYEVDLRDNPTSEKDYERLKNYYPESAGFVFYGNVAPKAKHKQEDASDAETSEKKKLKP